MKFIPLHATNTAIIYKNSLCSSATIIVLVFVALSVMIPVFLVSLLSPYSGIADSRVLYEQPHVEFKYQNIFIGDIDEASNDQTNSTLIACSSFEQFNKHMEDYTDRCGAVKYWHEDLDYDNNIDRAHFELDIDLSSQQFLQRFDLTLFFEATLKHKCILSPPALLSHTVNIPSSLKLGPGNILLKGELQLKQYVEFTCPFPGRNIKTHFRNIFVHDNITNDDMEKYQSEFLLNQLKANPAYFTISMHETYFRPNNQKDLKIHLSLDILQVPARYHLSIWERLGQFWLYFASFFGISFYVMNKIKDFLFGNHIIRSWEIIPWKKLY